MKKIYYFDAFSLRVLVYEVIRETPQTCIIQRVGQGSYAQKLYKRKIDLSQNVFGSFYSFDFIKVKKMAELAIEKFKLETKMKIELCEKTIHDIEMRENAESTEKSL